MLLTAQEVSKQFRVSTKTVYELARTARLRCVRLGRVVRFRQEDLDAYAAGGGDTRNIGTRLGPSARENGGVPRLRPRKTSPARLPR